MSILEDLYNGQYQPKPLHTAESETLRKKELQFWEEIEQTMGVKFLESHWDHRVELETQTRLNDFREGFCLGAALMLELLPFIQ